MGIKHTHSLPHRLPQIHTDASSSSCTHCAEMPARLLSLLEPTQDEKQWLSQAHPSHAPYCGHSGAPSSRPKHIEVQRELVACLSSIPPPRRCQSCRPELLWLAGFVFPLSPPRAAVLAWRGPKIWVITVRNSGSFKELQASLIQKPHSKSCFPTNHSRKDSWYQIF